VTARLVTPGLRHHHAIFQIDRADAVELGHAEQDTILGRQSAARQRRAGAPRHHLDVLRMQYFSTRQTWSTVSGRTTPWGAGDRPSGRPTRRGASRIRARSALARNDRAQRLHDAARRSSTLWSGAGILTDIAISLALVHRRGQARAPPAGRANFRPALFIAQLPCDTRSVHVAVARGAARGRRAPCPAVDTATRSVIRAWWRSAPRRIPGRRNDIKTEERERD